MFVFSILVYAVKKIIDLTLKLQVQIKLCFKHLKACSKLIMNLKKLMVSIHVEQIYIFFVLKLLTRLE